MATLQTLLDDLNQRLGDASNAAGVGEAAKIRWVANGFRAMWPKVYQTIIDDSSLAIIDGQYEYDLPAAFDNSEIFRVEVQVGPSLERWVRVEDYLTDDLESKVISFSKLPGIATAGLRIRAAAPLAEPTAASSTLTVPSRYYELPVWYALGLAMDGGHYERRNHNRYSTVVAQNRVDIGEIMSSAQFCFAQFELLLDRMAMPWPAG